MKSGKINVDYFSFILDKVEYLELNVDYINFEINEVVSINYNNDYGKLYVGKVGKLVGWGDYILLKVNIFIESLNVNIDYGLVMVEWMIFFVKDVVVDLDYVGVKLYYDSNVSFNFYVDFFYVSFNGEEDLEVLKILKDYSSKMYSGYYGKKDFGNLININLEYGGVIFKKF